MKKDKVIKVSASFYTLLKRGHSNFNKVIKERFGREITFIDYTDLLAKSVFNDLELINKPLFLFPIKKGRKSRKIKFELFEF